jgi:hypothetical protein
MDGQPCIVNQQYSDSFSCIVSSKDKVSETGVPTVGSNGIRRSFVNRTAIDNVNVNFDDMTEEPFVDKLLLTWEQYQSKWERSGDIYRTWFTAPETS